MCDKIVTPAFDFEHLQTQVPKSPHSSHDSESAKGGLGTHGNVGLKKGKKIEFFCLGPF